MTTPSRFYVRFPRMIAFMGASAAATSASAMMDMPMQQAPAQQMLTQQMPAQQVPMQQVPMQQMPMQQMPMQQMPMQQMPAQQMPAQQMPMQQMPMQQMPAQQMPMQQMPMQQMPMQQMPAQQMPMQQMPMMQMMQMMMSRMGAMPQQPALAQPGQGMPGAGPSVLLDRLDGRIAFLHAELRITQAQMPAWNEFATALRANAQRLTELRVALAGVSPPAGGSVVLATLEQGESVLAARLDGLRTIRASYGRLLAVLDDAQRRMAEELVWPHLGLS